MSGGSVKDSTLNTHTNTHTNMHTPTSEKIIFAHRGLNRHAPENTMPAFRAAYEAGCTWLEMDVDVLGDGTPIVLHDSTLNRTSNRQGSIYALQASDLADIDAGSWFSPEYAGERIPTFAEFVDFVNETGMNVNVELKAHEYSPDLALHLVESVAREVERMRGDVEIIVSSFSHIQLYEFHRHAPHITTALLLTKENLSLDCCVAGHLCGATYLHLEDGALPADMAQQARQHGLGNLDEGLTPELIAAVRERGLGVNVWTVNQVERAQELFDWGVTGVFTDCADKFLSLLPQ